MNGFVVEFTKIQILIPIPLDNKLFKVTIILKPMIFIQFKTLDWEHFTIVVICSILAIFCLILTVLFVKKYILNKKKPILLLVMFSIFSFVALIFYILEDLILGDITDIFQSLYMISFVFLPFLLLRFGNTIFASESNKILEYILYGLMVIIAVSALVFPEADYLESLGYLLILLVLINLFINMIIKPSKFIKKVERNEVFIHHTIKMIINSGKFFFGFVLLFLSYDFFKGFSPLLAVFVKIIALLLFSGFLFIAYIGFYIPKFYKRKKNFQIN